jgi:hypothetical protein
MHARALQRPSPDDVVYLVKPRFEFDQSGNLFPVLSCLHQRLHDRGVWSHPIQGLLDGQDIRISRTFCKKSITMPKVLYGG